MSTPLILFLHTSYKLIGFGDFIGNNFKTYLQNGKIPNSIDALDSLLYKNYN